MIVVILALLCSVIIAIAWRRMGATWLEVSLGLTIGWGCYVAMEMRS